MVGVRPDTVWSMAQQTCIAVLGVGDDEVSAANARLSQQYREHAGTFAFTLWRDPDAPEHTEAFMNCPERWFINDYAEGHWPRIAAFLEAALVAWPDEIVCYYSDAGSPSDGYRVGHELIDYGWELWRDPEVHREWWNIPKRCQHDDINLTLTRAAGDLPTSRESQQMVLSCTCGLSIEAPIQPEDAPLVSDVLRDPALRLAFLHVMQTAPDCAWGEAAKAVAATAL
jgi:hypothetical protein